ncbi:MAG: tRNA pseudouridine(13) synthase TruD [Planctomycetaceae bacterium]
MTPFDSAVSDDHGDPPLAASLPQLTASLPGVGGRIKVEPEDFVVEELPAYQPTGAGEHLFLWIEKRDVSADALLSHIARRLGIARGDIGMAGLKDRRAVTRQYVSVPASVEARLPEVDADNVRVLSSARHGNKLRTGHLRGNRFDVLIRDVVDDAGPRAESIIAALSNHGLPNYYGDQRFGHGGETLRLGLDLLTGRRQERDIPRPQRRFLLRLALSSVQSSLFNAVLAERVRTNQLTTVLIGDVLQVVASGGQFVCVDPVTDQARCQQREVVPTGPIFGPKMRAAQEAAGELEQRVLATSGLTVTDFARYRKLLPGTRRALAVWPDELSLAVEPTGLRVRFALPPGSYATVLLGESMKVELQEGA